MRIQVKDFMSSPVSTAVGSNNVWEIRTLMKRKGIHAVPIIQYSKKLPRNEAKIRGIITSSDLTESLDDKTLAEEIMSEKIYIVHKDTSAKSAAQMMLKRNVHHLVVMDEGEVAGMVSSLDFVKLVAEHNLS